jgi:hypothetical protein
MKNKSLIAMEIIWISTGVLCIVAAIKMAVTGGGFEIAIFALMAVISFTFAWLRDRQRKKS